MRHEFVEHIPEQIEEGVLYVSLAFDLAVHRCFCGCGNEVVTPFSPAEWSLTYDGKSVSLYPSIGNWSFPCKSHYFIRRGEIAWARKWSDKEIAAVRETDYAARAELYDGVPLQLKVLPAESYRRTLWSRIKSWLS